MGKPFKRMCNRGHDTWVTGRQPDGHCQGCRPRSGRANGYTNAPRLPFEPLETFLLAKYGSKSAMYRVAGGGNVTRYRKAGIPIWTADRIACAEGTHPALLWGDEWWAA